MGFRSTLISEEISVDWPSWFREKYHQLLTAEQGEVTTLSQRWEVKTYFWPELPEDIRRALIESGYFGDRGSFSMVWLHECGGITKVQIDEEGIRMADPDDWVLTDSQDGLHWYCYGCSDLRKIAGPVVAGF